MKAWFTKTFAEVEEDVYVSKDAVYGEYLKTSFACDNRPLFFNLVVRNIIGCEPFRHVVPVGKKKRTFLHLKFKDGKPTLTHPEESTVSQCSSSEADGTSTNEAEDHWNNYEDDTTHSIPDSLFLEETSDNDIVEDDGSEEDSDDVLEIKPPGKKKVREEFASDCEEDIDASDGPRCRDPKKEILLGKQFFNGDIFFSNNRYKNIGQVNLKSLNSPASKTFHSFLSEKFPNPSLVNQELSDDSSRMKIFQKSGPGNKKKAREEQTKSFIAATFPPLVVSSVGVKVLEGTFKGDVFPQFSVDVAYNIKHKRFRSTYYCEICVPFQRYFLTSGKASKVPPLKSKGASTQTILDGTAKLPFKGTVQAYEHCISEPHRKAVYFVSGTSEELACGASKQEVSHGINPTRSLGSSMKVKVNTVDHYFASPKNL